MLFRQLFDYETYTYTYLLGDISSRQAALIDPVDRHLDAYLQLMSDLSLTLSVALDTHIHADHITALGLLREKTQCLTYLGNVGGVACADQGLHDGQQIKLGDITIDVIYTPGHTDDSYCFFVKDDDQSRVFTGDTLLIRGCGRTDFQNGDAQLLYESIHQRLLTLPGETLVYPGHDYKGWMMSTIAEEKQFNPRLQLSAEDFIAHMNQLNLPHPKWMDVAVPANQSCGNQLGK